MLKFRAGYQHQYVVSQPSTILEYKNSQEPSSAEMEPVFFLSCLSL